MMAPVSMAPIGFVRTAADPPPHGYSVSDREGTLALDEAYREGLEGIRPGQRITVLFHFHLSPPFAPRLLRQKSWHRAAETGVFNLCSPVRPNPIGLTVLEVLGVDGSRVRVRGIDMLDGTPILDIKPEKPAPPCDGAANPKLAKKLFPFRGARGA